MTQHRIIFTHNINRLRSLTALDWLIICSMSIAFCPTFYRLATLGWKAADYTHAFFIVPVSIWLVLRRAGEMARLERIHITGMCVFITGVLCYLFAAINAFMFLEAISFILVCLSVGMIKFNRESFKKLIFPISYLWFMVPPPLLAIDTVTMPLKTIAISGSYVFLKAVGLPVSVQGAILKVGEYDFFVADACSGYRSMVTLLALGALYAYLQKTTLIKKWIIFLSVIPLGIAGNVFRIFVTGCLGHYVGIKFAEGFFHEFSGAVVFLIAILGLIFITDRLTDAYDR